MKLYIKNMVCDRCIMVVKKEFQNIDIPIESMQLGLVETRDDIPLSKLDKLQQAFQVLGFEIIDDRKSRIIEKVKAIIIQLVHHSDGLQQLNLSELIASAIHHDYKYISTLFSEVEGTTIEKYFIRQKIERIKELLVYDELSVSQISFDLGYSSVAHLSNQFKQVTGFTPSQFKALRGPRKPLDKI